MRGARPRLLRLLRSEIVLVALGDGVTIVGCATHTKVYEP